MGWFSAKVSPLTVQYSHGVEMKPVNCPDISVYRNCTLLKRLYFANQISRET